MLEVVLVAEYHVALSECCCGKSRNSGVLYSVVFALPVACFELMLAEVYLCAAPCIVVHAAVADSADHFAAAEVTVAYIVHSELHVVLVELVKSGILYSVGVLEIAPCEQRYRVSIGKCELEVVAGIVPASGYLVGILAAFIDHRVGSPRNVVPLRENA